MKGLGLAVFRALGAGIAIAVMEYLAALDGEPLFRVPFVTSIVLAMALPDSDPARPRAIIGGHVMSSLAGYLALALLGAGEHASALGVGLATLAMLASRTVHPPAGINAFLVGGNGLPFTWLLNPVIIGAVLLVAFALLWRRLERILFLPGERAAAPAMWSIERVKERWRSRGGATPPDRA